VTRRQAPAGALFPELHADRSADAVQIVEIGRREAIADADHGLHVVARAAQLQPQPPYVRGELMLIATSTGFMEVRQLAFNNLAYDLAVYRRRPDEALPLARKALGYGADHPELLDTIGWIEHLMGDDESAIQHLRSAVSRMPANAAVWLHAAVVAATINEGAEAEKYLATALQMDPELQTSQDAAAVRGILHSPR